MVFRLTDSALPRQQTGKRADGVSVRPVHQRLQDLCGLIIAGLPCKQICQL